MCMADNYTKILGWPMDEMSYMGDCMDVASVVSE
jgi:hypothetical protein